MLQCNRRLDSRHKSEGAGDPARWFLAQGLEGSPALCVSSGLPDLLEKAENAWAIWSASGRPRWIQMR